MISKLRPVVLGNNIENKGERFLIYVAQGQGIQQFPADVLGDAQVGDVYIFPRAFYCEAVIEF